MYDVAMEVLLRPLLRLFAILVSRGGEPRVEAGGRLTTFPLRPGLLCFAIACLGLCAVEVVVQGRRLLHYDWSIAVLWQFAGGIVLGWLGVELLTQKLWLDEDGLRFSRVLGRDKLIRWDSFSHFERYHSREAGKATYFFRSKPQGLSGEEVTITVPEMSYNTGRLTEEISKRVRLIERPRMKRHWWGG